MPPISIKLRESRELESIKEPEVEVRLDDHCTMMGSELILLPCSQYRCIFILLPLCTVLDFYPTSLFTTRYYPVSFHPTELTVLIILLCSSFSLARSIWMSLPVLTHCGSPNSVASGSQVSLSQAGALCFVTDHSFFEQFASKTFLPEKDEQPTKRSKRNLTQRCSWRRNLQRIKQRRRKESERSRVSVTLLEWQGSVLLWLRELLGEWECREIGQSIRSVF